MGILNLIDKKLVVGKTQIEPENQPSWELNIQEYLLQ